MVSLNMNLHNEAEYIAIYLVSVYAMFGCGGCIPHKHIDGGSVPPPPTHTHTYTHIPSLRKPQALYYRGEQNIKQSVPPVK